ncbi:MAG: PQQ-binding-like beta-propeller repeat protein [Candidatus Aenigmatarchaeota archaeon]
MKSAARIATLLSALVVSFVIFGAVEAFACAGGGGVWYSFQHNWHHSGRSTCDMSGNIVNLNTWDVGVEKASPAYRYTVDDTVYEGNVFVASNDGRVYALSDTDWSTVWQSDAYSGTKTTPLQLDGRLIFGSGSHVVALDVYTGQQLWDYTGSATAQFNSNPSALPDGSMFYIGSDDGNVYAFDAQAGSVEWTYQTGGAVKSSPALDSGTVYAGSDDGYMYALSATGGDLVWRTQAVGRIRSSPTVSSQNMLFFGVVRSDGTGAIYSLDGDNGNVEWSRTMSSAVESTIALDNRTGVIYVGSNDGYVYALDGDNGDITWSHLTGDAVTASPAITDAFILAGSQDGNIYGLSVSNGEVLWSYDTGEPLIASFAIDSQKIFASTASHTYAIGPVQEQPLEFPIGPLTVAVYLITIIAVYAVVKRYRLLDGRFSSPGGARKK